MTNGNVNTTRKSGKVEWSCCCCWLKHLLWTIYTHTYTQIHLCVSRWLLLNGSIGDYHFERLCSNEQSNRERENNNNNSRNNKRGLLSMLSDWAYGLTRPTTTATVQQTKSLLVSVFGWSFRPEINKPIDEWMKWIKEWMDTFRLMIDWLHCHCFCAEFVTLWLWLVLTCLPLLSCKIMAH